MKFHHSVICRPYVAETKHIETTVQETGNLFSLLVSFLKPLMRAEVLSSVDKEATDGWLGGASVLCREPETLKCSLLTPSSHR